MPTFAAKNKTTMANQYDTDRPVTMASEPAVAYLTSSTKTKKPLRNHSMTVDEYFDKVRKALDQRYENL